MIGRPYRLTAADPRADAEALTKKVLSYATAGVVVTTPLVGVEQRTGIPHAAPPVAMTLMLRKRAAGQPWLTWFDCPGSPLPSLNVPPRK